MNWKKIFITMAVVAGGVAVINLLPLGTAVLTGVSFVAGGVTSWLWRDKQDGNKEV